MFECVCGYKGNASHSKTCSRYKEETDRVEKNLKKYIRDLYLENLSVSECCNLVQTKEETNLSEAKLRKIIDKNLTDLGIKRNLSDKEFNHRRLEKTKKTMLDRYGVINNGQRPGQGWKNLNAIPYDKLSVDEDLTNFRKAVDYLTRKYVEKLKRHNSLPTVCYYTGIQFKDATQGKVNPNDPYKRSVDHRTPVIEMFFKGFSPEQVCAEENIVFCLRAVNTYKANTTEEYFVKEIVPYLMEKL